MVKDSLEDRPHSPVHEDMRLQRAIWLAERIAWAVMALIVLLALFGAFSLGPLSRTQSVSAGGTRISHEAILRDGRGYDFVLTRNGFGAGQEVAVALSGLDFEKTEITGITPQPLGHDAGEAATRLIFRSGDDGSLKINFRVEPQSPGPGSLSFAVADEPPVSAGFFVLP
jgi:hypothetical protein